MNSRVKRLALPLGGAIAATSMIGATLVTSANAATAPVRKSAALASSGSAQKIANFWKANGGANLKAAAQFTGDQQVSGKVKLGGGDAKPDGKAGVIAPIGQEKVTPTKVKNVNLPKTIGKVFFTVGDKEYWCSASSVQSKYHNLVATAGHCVFDEGVQNGALDNWVFIPGYYQGKTPWGIYVGKAAYTHYDFAVYEDYDSDYAFVTVYNGITYAGEKQVTKETYDNWQGYKYAKDVEITAEEYKKKVDEKGGESADAWAKTSGSEKIVPWGTKDAVTATKEVTKDEFDAASKVPATQNFHQAPELTKTEIVDEEFYNKYTGPGYKKIVDSAFTITHYYLAYAVEKTSTVKYYKTVFFIEYYKDAGRLGDNVGGQGFTWNQKVGQPVYVFGYPAAPHPDGDKPFTGVTPKWCYGKTFAAKAAAAFKAEAQIGLKCSMTAGSSGAPWLLKYSSTKRLGYINGVTSLIGDADTNGRIDFSTSPYFDTETYSIYKAAANLWSGSIVAKDGDVITKA
ncbi:trypsin-like serine peptidase [Sphaerisporangium rhizosphaerae]|uniref:Trypsin-like serine peptidase n=1 Tax=Sphaerisporangium rhizosphaerae TaxID=2269375 RepID=A0ABW2PEV3_9ACTN